ncbi:MAG: dihydroorotate dehydrogenase [Rhodopirellula sp.]|nr:dihydroorotate dehydrogenase [Rhodopirellula sp.]OUX52417.1 MAG: dihydroorotate dehydrogenase [Rhodopirellula sp. TMED283]
MSQPLLYKLLSQREWQQVLEAQALAGFGIDLLDGFIHLSTAEQVKETARLYFAGHEDLMLVSIDSSCLEESLRWEKSRAGALFPHVYGVIPMSAVLGAETLPLGVSGEHEFSF